MIYSTLSTTSGISIIYSKGSLARPGDEGGQEEQILSLIYRYKRPAVTGAQKSELLASVQNSISAGSIGDINTEYCFYIEAKEPLSTVRWNCCAGSSARPLSPGIFRLTVFLTDLDSRITPSIPPLLRGAWGVIEVGPRMNFTTAWSSNAVSVCHACGLTKITRIERSRRYKVVEATESQMRRADGSALVSALIT